MPEEIKSNTCEFGTELDVERITGRSRQTLQKDRYFGRGFPFYRVGRQVIYDLNEVRRLIRAGRIEGQTGTHRGQVREVPDVDAYLRDIEATAKEARESRSPIVRRSCLTFLSIQLRRFETLAGAASITAFKDEMSDGLSDSGGIR